MNRFQRVIEILDESVGGPDAGFAGHGPFWRGLTRDEFVAFKVFGQHQLLIVGDGAASNLVKSLKGEFPFGEDLDDPPSGARWPRMPLGLDPVPDNGIGFIETWIDDGCPEVDEPMAGEFAWRPTTAPPAQRYDDIWFRDTELGWAVNSAGQILRTADGGKHWEVQFQAPVDLSSLWLRSIGFATDTRGWVGTTAGEAQLFETSDGGATWTAVTDLPAEAPAKVCGISVVDESVVYASGTNEPTDTPRIMKTVDGGQTWQARDMTAHASILIDIYFTSPDTGWVVGGKEHPVTPADRQCRRNLARSKIKPVVLRTTDGGQTWTNRLAGMESQFPLGEWGWKIFFLDETVGFISLENFCEGAILKTTDGGDTWTRLPINDVNKNANLEGIGFVDENRGWVGGWGTTAFPNPNGLSSETTDGGQTWGSIDWGEPQTGEYLNRFRFVGTPPVVGYASGNTIYKYSTESAAPPVGAVAAAPSLFTAPGPVPTGRPARIGLTVPEGAAELSVDVWDRFGSYVRQLVRETGPTGGERNIEWAVDNQAGEPLEPAYYMVRATIDDRTDSTLLLVEA
ncbi:YCF48-related protein [Mycolicibacterium sp. XJ870]